jgi:hypothetical protein
MRLTAWIGKSWQPLRLWICLEMQRRSVFRHASTVQFSGLVKLFSDDLMLSLHFDRGRKSPKLDSIVDRVTKAYSGAPAIVNISFNPVKAFTPLQAADVIATENYWRAGQVIAGNNYPRPHFDHFLKRGHTTGYILQEAVIFQTLRRHGL